MKTFIRILFIILIPITIINGQWTKSIVIGGQCSVYDIALKNDTIFLATSEGFYYSTNSGDQWNYSGPWAYTVSELVINGNNIWGCELSGHGLLYLSTDNGASWTSENKRLKNLEVYYLSIHDNTLFAGTIEGLYSSTDNGGSWHYSGLNGLVVLVLYTKGTKIYAGTNNGVYYSPDNGISWDSLNTGLINIRITAITSIDSNLIAGSDNGGVYTFPNNNNSWNKVNTIPPDSSLYKTINTLLSRGNELYAGTWTGIYVSGNYGSTWTKLDSGFNDILSPRPTTDIYITSLINIDSTIYAGTWTKGLFSLNNNGTKWNYKSIGITSIPATNAFTNIGDKLYCGTYGNGVFLSTDEGATWYPQNYSPLYINSLVHGDSSLFTGSNSGLYVLNDTCTSWTTSYKSEDYQSVILGKINNKFYASFTNGLYYSTDGGLSWNPLNLRGEYGVWVRTFAYTGTNFLAGTWDGLYLSTDDGISWNAINNEFPTYSDLYILAVSGDSVFLGVDGAGMYVSTDNGLSWSEINNGFSNKDVQCLAINGENIFAGTDHGLFYSSDNGKNWEKLNDYMSSYDIKSLFIHGDYIYAGTSNGIFYQMLSGITGVKKDNLTIPKLFSISQNYPNPFNPTTTIKYTVPKESLVSIKVYDVLGKEIKTLVNEDKPAGSYEVEFNGSKYSSGIYFYRIKAGNFSSVKKMILMK